MSEFYDQPMFGSRKLVDKGKGKIMWELLMPNGVQLGYMEVERQSLGVRMLQATLKASYPINIEVFNTKEQKLLRIEKVFAAGAMQVILRSSEGKLLGAMSQQNIKGSVEKGSSDYQVIDAEKVLIGSLRGHWRANMLQLYDEKNNIIGKISRHDPSINRTVFAMGQRYHIVHVYFPPKNQVRRMLLLSIAAAIDVLII